MFDMNAILPCYIIQYANKATAGGVYGAAKKFASKFGFGTAAYGGGGYGHGYDYEDYDDDYDEDEYDPDYYG